MAEDSNQNRNYETGVDEGGAFLAVNPATSHSGEEEHFSGQPSHLILRGGRAFYWSTHLPHTQVRKNILVVNPATSHSGEEEQFSIQPSHLTLRWGGAFSAVNLPTSHSCEGSVADPVGSGPFSRIRIWSNFPDPVPDPDPTIKSHIKRSKYNKSNRYFCETFMRTSSSSRMTRRRRKWEREGGRIMRKKNLPLPVYLEIIKIKL